MDTYVVLRDLNGQHVSEPFGTRRDVGPALRSFAPPEPRIELADLEPRERNELTRDPTVSAIAREMPVHVIAPVATSTEVTESQASSGPAWGVSEVGADRSQLTGAGVTVAVLDSGIDRNHPAFAGIDIVEQDFTGAGPGDGMGHGTHCAGTICGRDVDGMRIGVAPGVTRLLAGRVIDAEGRSGTFAVFNGIQWALDQGANVISMSLGLDFPGGVATRVAAGWPPELATSITLEAYRGNVRMFDALMSMIRAREAFGAGTVVVAAAGNDSDRERDARFEVAAALPAAAEGVVSVAALGRTPQGLVPAHFSNTFPKISAPGVDVASAAMGGGLTMSDGTSMACPHVAGVAALWWEFVARTGLLSVAPTVAAKLIASARTDVFAPGTDAADVGAGLVTAP
jgi:subtilisin family serine protease